jgi:hypothetical protein
MPSGDSARTCRVAFTKTNKNSLFSTLLNSWILFQREKRGDQHFSMISPRGLLQWRERSTRERLRKRGFQQSPFFKYSTDNPDPKFMDRKCKCLFGEFLPVTGTGLFFPGAVAGIFHSFSRFRKPLGYLPPLWNYGCTRHHHPGTAERRVLGMPGVRVPEGVPRIIFAHRIWPSPRESNSRLP